MEHFFSPSTGGFFNELTHGARLVAEPQTEAQIKARRQPKYRPNPECQIPVDAVAVSHDQWQELLVAQGRGQIIAVKAGRVVAVDRPAPLAEEQLAQIRARRDRLLADTDIMVTVPDYPITEDQRAELVAWRVLLRDFPAEIAPMLPVETVEWPVAPGWLADKGVQL